MKRDEPGRELGITLPGMQIAALEWGADRPRKVLAVHGWLDNAASFARLGPLLPDVHLVALDLPGHGHSDHKPEGTFYHFVEWGYDVLAVLVALGWEKADLLGHSMGAGIAPLVAITDPARVRSLALIEGFGPLSSEADEVPDRIAQQWVRRTTRRGQRMRRHPDLDSAIKARRLSVPLAADAARFLVERAMVAVDDGYEWRSDPRLRWPSPLPFTESHVMALLPRVTCPTLLIQATDGLFVEPEKLAARLAQVPQARHLMVEGHHHVHLETPERVAPLLLRFWEEAGQ